jgi:hypothetical protein
MGSQPAVAPSIVSPFQPIHGHNGNILRIANHGDGTGDYSASRIRVVGQFYWNTFVKNNAVRAKLAGILNLLDATNQEIILVAQKAVHSPKKSGKLLVNYDRPFAVMEATESESAKFLIYSGIRADSVLVCSCDSAHLELLHRALSSVNVPVSSYLRSLEESWIPQTEKERQELMKRKPYELPVQSIAHMDNPISWEFIKQLCLVRDASLNATCFQNGMFHLSSVRAKSLIQQVYPKVGANMPVCYNFWLLQSGFASPYSNGEAVTIDNELLQVRYDEIVEQEALEKEILEQQALEQEALQQEALVAELDESVEMVKMYVEEESATMPPPQIATVVAGATKMNTNPQPSTATALLATLVAAQKAELERQPLIDKMQQIDNHLQSLETEISIANDKKANAMQLVQDLEEQILIARNDLQSIEASLGGMEGNKSIYLQTKAEAELQIQELKTPKLSLEQRKIAETLARQLQALLAV